jgi:hypothetical protein
MMEDFNPLAYTDLEFPCSLIQTAILLGLLEKGFYTLRVLFCSKKEIKGDRETQRGRKGELVGLFTNLKKKKKLPRSGN